MSVGSNERVSVYRDSAVRCLCTRMSLDQSVRRKAEEWRAFTLGSRREAGKEESDVALKDAKHFGRIPNQSGKPFSLGRRNSVASSVMWRGTKLV